MSIKIISDTGADITREDQAKHNVTMIPFHLNVRGVDYIDDENLDIHELEKSLSKVELKIGNKEPSMHSACPSPYDYFEVCKKNSDSDIMILTISSKLSGSYNSACLAAKMFTDKYPDRKVYVFDSRSASAGQAAILYKITELVEQGQDFDEIVDEVEKGINDHTIFVVLERLQNIVNSGRLSNGKALVAKILNVKPLMEGKGGELVVASIQRGVKNALNAMVSKIKETYFDFSDKVLVIAHADAFDSAQYVADKIKEIYNFKDIVIVQMRGISTCYADLRGVVISYI